MKYTVFTSVVTFFASSALGLHYARDVPPAGEVQTGPIYITQPLEGATLVAGGNQTVSWINPREDVNKLVINLLDGNPNALQVIQTLAQDVDAAAGTYNVQIPQNATGSGYALGVGTNSTDMAYIGALTISSQSPAGGSASGSPSPTPALVRRHGKHEESSTTSDLAGDTTTAPAGVPTTEPVGAPTTESAGIPTTESAGAPTTEPIAIPTTEVAGAPTTEPSGGVSQPGASQPVSSGIQSAPSGQAPSESSQPASPPVEEGAASSNAALSPLLLAIPVVATLVY